MYSYFGYPLINLLDEWELMEGLYEYRMIKRLEMRELNKILSLFLDFPSLWAIVGQSLLSIHKYTLKTCTDFIASIFDKVSWIVPSIFSNTELTTLSNIVKEPTIFSKVSSSQKVDLMTIPLERKEIHYEGLSVGYPSNNSMLMTTKWIHFDYEYCD